MDKPALNFWWESREPARADDARRLSEFVSGLPDFDPIYQSWLDSPTTREQTVPVPLSEAEAKQILADNIARSSFDHEPLPTFGSYIWGGHAGRQPYDFRESSYADTRCHLGSHSGPPHASANKILMRLSAVRPSLGRPWRASEIRPLMKFAREIWNPVNMSVAFSFQGNDFPSRPSPVRRAPGLPLSPRIGWVSYLPQDLASRAKYPADVEVETLPDGAALVTLCEEQLEKTDAEGVARLRALEAALRPIQS